MLLNDNNYNTVYDRGDIQKILLMKSLGPKSVKLHGAWCSMIFDNTYMLPVTRKSNETANMFWQSFCTTESSASWTRILDRMSSPILYKQAK